MSAHPLFAKTLSAFGLVASSLSYASSISPSQHIEFSYNSDCRQGLCATYRLHTFEAPQAPSWTQLNLLSEPADYQYVAPNHFINALNAPKNSLNEEAKANRRYLYVSEEKDWQYLKEQTYTILGLSVATVGLMTMLPESITKWDDDARDISNLGSKWKDNVTAGPVWDEDEHFLNYIMHPYFGGVYYTAARHAGYDEFESFLYSATMSTFFWEYGVESFAEIPSWQDLFITPFFGAVVGEMMLDAEQNIVANRGQVWGSERLGSVSLFLLNPVGHIHYWVTDAWDGSAELNFSSTPWFGNQEVAKYALDAGASYDNRFYGVELKVHF
ncbi:DUF3943 domain-containing protein [Vibrio sp. SM6]|uniref:DUF3943 domain-containing protein n=1 Tax=Vibrio agarilyticus TaxID=2726741 RepID=A0A7X8YHT4_9VIBR|nr:DUF3943 domain-containing protein [Vibrio agarilyticus]